MGTKTGSSLSVGCCLSSWTEAPREVGIIVSDNGCMIAVPRAEFLLPPRPRPSSVGAVLSVDAVLSVNAVLSVGSAAGAAEVGSPLVIVM